MAEATATLEVIVAEEPWRERAVELLVIALAQAGRSAHALAALAGHRERLRDELGLDPPPRLQRLQEQVLRGTFHPVAPAGGDRRGPRTPATSFVGRERELALVGRSLAAGRLVTLVGPGGVGKTRLAQEVTAGHDPVWWVDLAPLRDPGAVPYAVAGVVGIELLPGAVLAAALGQWAGRARGLLVLDNCEHLLAAVAGLAEELVAVSSSLVVLATSRERLAVGGEQAVVVPPLELPASGAEELDGAAVRLFLDRARAADPELVASPRLLRRVGDVCRALDGLPLAIELAAARIGTLTVDDLADRLDARFDLLRTGRGGDARHQALRAVVDWSFELLGADERRLFLRLSVFAAAFDIAAAETVAADDNLPPGRVADLVARLAEQSMLTRPGPSGVGRYRMLETLRAYAASRLPEVEAERLRRRHASVMVDLAERAEAGLYGPRRRRGRIGSSAGWMTCGPPGAEPGTPARSTAPCGSPPPSPGMPTGACGTICSPGGPGRPRRSRPIPAWPSPTRPRLPTPGSTAGSRRRASWPGGVWRPAAARRRRPRPRRWRRWGMWRC